MSNKRMGAHRISHLLGAMPREVQVRRGQLLAAKAQAEAARLARAWQRTWQKTSRRHQHTNSSHQAGNAE